MSVAKDLGIVADLCSVGAKQTLSFLKGPQDPDAIVLVFCGRDRKQSGIDGTLRLGADSAFIDARWRIWNPAQCAKSIRWRGMNRRAR